MIPAAAVALIPALVLALRDRAPDVAPWAPYIAAQVDHETGCGWKPKSCWNPRAELKTARERGVGLAQITRVYGRFDALAELKAKHPDALAGVDWSSQRLYDPQVQLTILALKQADTFARVRHMTTDKAELLAFQIVGHNRGVNGLLNDQALCRAKPGCNPGKWWGNVETTCAASKQPIYGGRSACDISREYPRDIIERRAPAYLEHFRANHLAFREAV